jgi:hypothetical protein
MRTRNHKNSKIDRYIQATRFNRPDRILSDLYNKYYLPPVRRYAQFFGPPVKIKVSYSSTRRAEHVTVEGQRWLVYDQYMGQTMNLLNRIFIEAQDEKPASTYLHKVFAERLLEVGQRYEALHCAEVYYDNKTYLDPKRVDEDERELFTNSQEFYYLFHELGHHVFPLDHPSCATVRNRAKELLEDRRTAYEAETAESVLAKFKAGPPAAYHYQAEPELIRDIRDSFSMPAGMRYRVAFLRAFDNKDLHEELFCDLLAADLTLGLNGHDTTRMSQVLRAIYVGFYHLQVLSYVDRWFFGQQKVTSAKWLERYIPIQIRQQCLKTHLLFLLDLQIKLGRKIDAKGNVESVESFSLYLMEDQKRYYEIILDVATGLVHYLVEGNRLRRLGRSAVNALTSRVPSLGTEEASIERDIAIDTAIRLMTGWLTDLKKPDEVLPR